MVRQRSRQIAIVAVAFLTVWTSDLTQAQVLDDFERDATKNRDAPPPSPPKHHNSYRDRRSHFDSLDDDKEQSLTGMLLEIGGWVFLAGGANSWQRMNPVSAPNEPADWSPPRKLGEPLIPLLRVDGSYQSIERYVDAWDYRVQAGYGPFALEYGDTRYREKAPEDYMNVRHAAFLYRMSAGHQIEIDMGLGSVELDGNGRHRSFCFSLPILYYPKEYLGFEFRPSWASFNDSRFNEYDLAACGNFHGLGLKLGYRWLVTPNSHLDGPYAGMVLRF